MKLIRKNINGLAKIHGINTKGDFVDKFMPARNARWSKIEGISYHTPILKITKLFLDGNSKKC